MQKWEIVLGFHPFDPFWQGLDLLRRRFFGSEVVATQWVDVDNVVACRRSHLFFFHFSSKDWGEDKRREEKRKERNRRFSLLLWSNQRKSEVAYVYVALGIVRWLDPDPYLDQSGVTHGSKMSNQVGSHLLQCCFLHVIGPNSVFCWLKRVPFPRWLVEGHDVAVLGRF